MTTIRKVAPPNLPLSPTQYSSLFQEQYSNVLRLFFNQLTNVINVNTATPYGSFYDTALQDNTSPGTPNITHINSVASAYKVSVVDGTSQNAKIFVAESGVYNIQFSAQIAKTGGGGGGSDTDVTFWLLQNGTAVPQSGGYVTMKPNTKLITAWNYVLPLQAQDYVQLAWSAPSSSVTLPYTPAAGQVPGSPSLILTINWVSSIAA